MKNHMKRFLALLLAFSFLLLQTPLMVPVQAAGEESENQVAQFVADNHVLMLRADGRLLGWGDNQYGQLGLGADAAAKYSTPVEIDFFKDLAPIQQILTIRDASFVLLTDGSLYSAGKGDNGRLGLGSLVSKNTWTLVPNSKALYINKLYGGADCMYSLTMDDSLYAVGKNDVGQLGTGDTVDKLLLTKALDAADIKQFFAGEDFAVIFKQDGKMHYTGNVANGRIGNHPIMDRAVVLSGSTGQQGTIFSGTNWQNPYIPLYYISNGAYVLANTDLYTLVNAGLAYFSAYSFGFRNDFPTVNFKPLVTQNRNTFGMLHPGVYGLEPNSDFIKIGDSGSYANYFYRLASPKQFASLYNNAETIILTYPREMMASYAQNKIDNLQYGNRHGIYLDKTDGKYYGFGDASQKQLLANVESSVPAVLTELNAKIAEMKLLEYTDARVYVAGDANYLTMTNPYSNTTKVWAWGGNTRGKLGVGSTTANYGTLTEVTALADKEIISVVPGRSNIFFLLADGSIHGTGDNAFGQLGLGSTYDNQIVVTAPVENKNVKFSFTAPPPAPVDEVDVPTEAEAGKKLMVKWNAVPDAASYELTRAVTYSSGEITETVTEQGGIAKTGAASVGQQVIYNGADTQYEDTASPDWESVNYSVRALNYVGDYSPSIGTGTIVIKIPSTPPTQTDTTPPTLSVTSNAATREVTIFATDTDSGMEGIYINGSKVATNIYIRTITAGEALSIYAKDNAGNVSSTKLLTYEQVVQGDSNNNNDKDKDSGGLTYEQMWALINSGKSSGMSAAELDAIISRAQSSGYIPITSGDSTSLTDLVALSALMEGKSTAAPAQQPQVQQVSYSIQGLDTSVTALTSFLSEHPQVLDKLLGGRSGGMGYAASVAFGTLALTIGIFGVLAMLVLVKSGTLHSVAAAVGGGTGSAGPKARKAHRAGRMDARTAQKPVTVRTRSHGLPAQAPPPNAGFDFVNPDRYRGSRFADIAGNFGHWEREPEPDELPTPAADNPVMQAAAQVWPEPPQEAPAPQVSQEFDIAGYREMWDKLKTAQTQQDAVVPPVSYSEDVPQEIPLQEPEQDVAPSPLAQEPEAHTEPHSPPAGQIESKNFYVNDQGAIVPKT